MCFVLEFFLGMKCKRYKQEHKYIRNQLQYYFKWPATFQFYYAQSCTCLNSDFFFEKVVEKCKQEGRVGGQFDYISLDMGNKDSPKRLIEVQ